MKKTYSILKSKPSLIIIAMLFLNCFSLIGQVKNTVEDAEDKNQDVKMQVYQNLEQQTGMSENEFNEFTHYYVDTLAKYIHRSFVYLKKHPDATINSPVIQKYITEKTAYYVQMYTNFKKIKAEFPSSVAEALAPRQPNKGQNLPCNPACDNIDFSSGTLAAWTEGYASCSSEDVGKNCPPAGGGPPAFSYTTPTYSTSATAAGAGPDASTANDYQVNVVGLGVDPNVGIQMVAPGYAYSAEIGDGNAVYYGVAFLEQKFIVTPANADFFYNYAVVLNNPSHCYHQQPYFNVAMLDQNGDTIPHCGNYNVVAGGANVSGAWQYKNKGTLSEIDYLDWTTAFVALKKYMGQCITVVVQTSDCGQGGHYGYAYFDAQCKTLGIITSAAALCGNPITLTAPNGGLAYQWTGPGAGCMTPAAGNTQTITVSCPGKYTVVITTVSGSACADTLDTIIASSTATAPIPNFKADTVCVGNATNFTNLTTPALGSNVYSWYFGTGTPPTDSSHLVNPTYTYPAAGTYSVYLKSTNGGCGGDTIIPVVVVGTPTAAFTASSVCLNTPTAFTNTSTGSIVYKWVFGDGSPNSTLPNPTHTYPACGTYTATLYVGIKGCIDSAKQTININPIPMPQFTSDTVCIANPTQFTDLSTIPCGGKITGWSWKFGDPANGTSTVQNPPYTYATTGTYNVTLTATSDSGCSAAVTLPALVVPNPVAKFSTGPVCLGQATKFTDLSTGPPAKWNWYFGDPLNSTSTVQNPSFTYTAAGTYTIKLVVSSGKGCVDSTIQTVTVNPIPTSGFTADTVCQGTATAFKDTSSGGTSWTWKFGDPPTNGTGTGQTPTYTYAAAGTYNVTEVVTSANGCKDSIILPVLVNPNPTGTFTVPPVCLGTPSVFTLTTSTPVSTYAWTFGDAVGTSSSQNPTYTYGAAGTYNVTVVITTAGACTGTVTGTAVVNSIPVADFTAPPVCQDKAMSFTNSSTVAGGGALTYVWNFGDGNSSALPNPTHQYAACGTYNVMLTASSGANCTHDTTITVTINPMPIPNFTGTNVCQGLTTTFTDASTIACGGTITGWAWSFGDAGTSTLQNPTHTYAAANIYSVTLTVTSNNGCDSMITLPVTVYPLPVPKFTAPPVCQGTPTTFTDGSTVPGGGIIKTWAWRFGDGVTSALQDPTHTYAAAGTYPVTLIVTSTEGCIDSITKIITVNPNPVPLFLQDSSACVPLCMHFYDSSKIAPPDQISTWLWNFGDGSSDSTSVLKNPTHCFNTVGTFTGTLTVTTNNGCSATYVKPNYITTWPIPVAKFTSYPNPTVLINNPTVTFIDQSTGNPVSWSWFNFGDGLDSTATSENTIHTYIDTGTFYVYLAIENKYGCKDTVREPVVVQPIWTFYVPNAFTPNADGLNDGFIGKGVGILKYEMWIFDRWGMLLYHCTDMQHPWDGTVQGSGGKECQEDTYVWLIEITDVFHGFHRYVGRVSIIK